MDSEGNTIVFNEDVIEAGEGGEFPVYECPECGKKQLAYDADSHKYHCFACDENFTDEELSFCSDCGRIMKSDEIDLCPDCAAYRMEKD